MASASRPIATAAETNSEGEKVPSDARVWVCRSIILCSPRCCKFLDDGSHTLIDTLTIGAALQIREFGSFVGIVDTGEMRELTGSGAAVKTFGVALLTYCQRRVHVDFK